MNGESKGRGVHAEQSGPTYSLRAGGSAERRRILVGISGGLNSAVAAALLRSQGQEVIGVHLQLFDPKQPKDSRFGSRCCLTRSVEAAQAVCAKLDIPLHVMPVDEEFEAKVVDEFVHELLRCHLPNPCIPCNREIRFSALFRKADQLGCQLVCTGHHAQVFHDAAQDASRATARLRKAVNPAKDQSYFLYGLAQAQLRRLLMPVGGFSDTMVSRLAAEFGIADGGVATPSHQQEICMVRGEGYKRFFESRVPASLRPKGVIRDTRGSVMGEHHGLYAFQIGHKVKLAQQIKDADQYQVVGFDPPSHALIMGALEHRTHSEARAVGANWLRPMDGLRGLRCAAKAAPGPAEAACSVTLFENGTVRIRFDDPQTNLVAGQAVVFYDGDEVLGGAMLEQMGKLG